MQHCRGGLARVLFFALAGWGISTGLGICLGLNLTPALYAQDTGAALIGVVHDPQGSVVGGAKVTMVNIATNARFTQTDRKSVV